jgi:hypothetical protein
MGADDKDKEYPTLVRLNSGTKTKLSTLVRTIDHELGLPARPPGLCHFLLDLSHFFSLATISLFS